MTARPAPLSTENASSAHHYRRKMLNDMGVKCELTLA